MVKGNICYICEEEHFSSDEVCGLCQRIYGVSNMGDAPLMHAPEQISPRELTEVFPEGRRMVKANIRLAKYQLLAAQNKAEQLLSVIRIGRQKKPEPFFNNIFDDDVIRKMLFPEIDTLRDRIRHLEQLKYLYEHPRKTEGGVVDKKEDWDERVRRAKDTRLEQIAPAYLKKERRVGNRIQARCPFHQEKTPSFYIFLNTNTYHCFGCNEGGDVIDFIMKLDGISFREAVSRLT